jgi:hypothetical protein
LKGAIVFDPGAGALTYLVIDSKTKTWSAVIIDRVLVELDRDLLLLRGSSDITAFMLPDLTAYLCDLAYASFIQERANLFALSRRRSHCRGYFSWRSKNT